MRGRSRCGAYAIGSATSETPSLIRALVRAYMRYAGACRPRLHMKRNRPYSKVDCGHDILTVRSSFISSLFCSLLLTVRSISHPRPNRGGASKWPSGSPSCTMWQPHTCLPFVRLSAGHCVHHCRCQCAPRQDLYEKCPSYWDASARAPRNGTLTYTHSHPLAAH